MAKGHVHADLMAQYAKDAKTNPKPWQLWQMKVALTGEWVDFYGEGPIWDTDTEYRRKPEPRYLNVYAGVDFTSFWRDTITELKRVRDEDCIGYLEDKQDGSTPVFHPLT